MEMSLFNLSLFLISDNKEKIDCLIQKSFSDSLNSTKSSDGFPKNLYC